MMKYQNNPCNLRFDVRNDWRGQDLPLNGFCRFVSLEFGLRATLKTLETYRKRGKKSIHQIISTFAPPSENNTSSYEDFVCDLLMDYFTRLSGSQTTFYSDVKQLYEPSRVIKTREEYCVLVCAMCIMESNTHIDLSYVCQVCRKYNIFNNCD